MVSLYSARASIGQQAVGQLKQQIVTQVTQVPWGHNLAIIAKCKDLNEALYYVQNTVNHGWSRSVLTHQIESGLCKREGSALSNFSAALPSPQSDLAQQTLKDPYVFDFLDLTKEHNKLGAGAWTH